MFFSLANLNAQDLYFSQFNENPALLNPALTGAKNPLRASISYKEQNRGITIPYRSFGMSFETRFTQSEWTQVDKHRTMTFKEKSISRLAAGLSVYTDRSGDGGLGTTLSNLSLAYFIPLNKNNFLSLGMQGSIVQKKVDNSKLLFPNQYDGTGYDPFKNSGEKFTTLYYIYEDFAGGILWSFKHTEKRISSDIQTKANVGCSVYHLNSAKQQFMLNGARQFMKYVCHGELLFSPLGKSVAFNPSFALQMQGPSQQLSLGSMVKYYTNFNSRYTGILKRSSFGFGGFYRSTGYLTAAVLLEKSEQYCINICYDFNVGSLNKTLAAMGGFELALRFTPPNAFLYQKRSTNASDR